MKVALIIGVVVGLSIITSLIMHAKGLDHHGPSGFEGNATHC